jgi:hypothetical protein
VNRLALIAFLATPAFAGGPVADYPDSTDPCAVPFPDFAAYEMTWVGDGAREGYAMAQLLRDRRCGDVQSPAETWAARGWTDATLLAAVFNGDDVPAPPAQVSLPSSGAMLAGALVLLWISRRRTRHA